MRYLPWLGILVTSAVGLASRDAAACSCEVVTLLSPRSGETGAPLNAVAVVAMAQNHGVIYDLTHDAAVPATVEPFAERDGVWLLRPTELLTANTTYEVRPVPFPGSSLSRFTTGNTVDDAAPEYAGIAGLVAETMNLRAPEVPCRSSCAADLLGRLRVDYPEPPMDTTLLLMDVRVEAAGGAVTTMTVPIFRRYSASTWRHVLENVGCDFGLPTFSAGDSVCARMAAFDMSGKRSAESPEVCARVSACAPQVDRVSCVPVDACLPLSSDAGPPDAGAPLDAGEMNGDATSEPIDPKGPGDNEEPPGPDAGRGNSAEEERGGCTLARGAISRAPRSSPPHTSNPLRLAAAGALAMLVRWRRRGKPR